MYKRFITFLFVCLTTLIHGQSVMTVELKDGKKIDYNVDVVSQITFGEKERPVLNHFRELSKYNFYPDIGDSSQLYGTYYRMVIGVDSEGWIYVAQRKCANNSGGRDVNIYRTKDFESYSIFKENSGGAQLIEMGNGELCFSTYETEEVEGTYYIKCNIYVTSQHKTIFNKKFFLYSNISVYTSGTLAMGHSKQRFVSCYRRIW